jgi:hypothetical protein
MSRRPRRVATVSGPTTRPLSWNAYRPSTMLVMASHAVRRTRYECVPVRWHYVCVCVSISLCVSLSLCVCLSLCRTVGGAAGLVPAAVHDHINVPVHAHVGREEDDRGGVVAPDQQLQHRRRRKQKGRDARQQCHHRCRQCEQMDKARLGGGGAYEVSERSFLPQGAWLAVANVRQQWKN